MTYWENSNFWDVSILSEPMFWVGTLLFAFIGYLIGSISGGHIISLFQKKDIGKSGSKSYGATNASRAFGKKGFAFVFIFDMFKSIVFGLFLVGLIHIPSQLITETNPDGGFLTYTSIQIAVSFVVVGHIWPVFFGFKGGKGVAPAFGAVIVLNWFIALIAISVFGIVKAKMGWMTLASVFGVGTGLVLILALQWCWPDSIVFAFSNHWLTLPAAMAVCLLVIFMHHQKLKEFIAGEKPWIRPSKKQNGK